MSVHEPSSRFPGLAAATPRRSANRRTLVFAGGVVLGSIGFAVVADSQVHHGMLRPLPAAQGEANVATALTKIAGFRRRGNLLIGEVHARDGTPIRLVLDATTQALVGFRILDRPRDDKADPPCDLAGTEAPAPPAR